MDKNTAVDEMVSKNNAAFNAEWELRYAVIGAVEAGASWAEIGEKLGISKQTAYNRYSKHVESERRQKQWAAENPEKAAAAVAKGVAEAQATIEAIRTKNQTGKTKKIRCTHCSWTIAYPPHEEEDAYMDFDDHMTTTHMDGAYSEHFPDEENTAKKFDAPAPAPRQTHVIPIPDETAQPGIGKGMGPHTCPSCEHSNHKAPERHLAAFGAQCVPTQYDPAKIAYLMWETNR